MNKLLVLILAFLNLSALDAFISPSELKNSLANDNLVIVDVGSIALYKKSHIQNAIHVDVVNYSKKEGSYFKMNTSDEIQELLIKLGVNSNSDLVIYSHNTDKGVLNSSYLALALITNGFERVSILDGGYMAWIFEYELFTSTEKNVSNEDGKYTISYNPNILVDFEYVKKSLNWIKILDSRLPSEYFGTSRSKNIETIGHIQSASSSYYKDKFLTDGTLREKDILDSIYLSGHEIGQNDEVIVYGTDVYEASMNWYILYKHMGYKDTKILNASLLELEKLTDIKFTKYKWE